VLQYAGSIFLPLARCYASFLKDPNFDPELFVESSPARPSANGCRRSTSRRRPRRSTFASPARGVRARLWRGGDRDGRRGMTHTQALRRFEQLASGAGVTLSALHPAHRSGRTIFPSRVFDPDEVGAC
jgi:hypothetical protein